jgi:pimeloyl-ACP methyl ester carboxylesterase
MRVVFVHGACVRDGSWWWHPTAQLLADRGVASVAPLLPSCGETGVSPDAQGPGLAEDVATVRQVLTEGDEPTVVVAHSYGGIVVAEAAAGVGAVAHLLLVSSYLPELGESLSTFGGEEPAPFLDIDPEGGTFTVRPESLAGTFLQDCGPEIQRQAVERTARQSLAVLGAPVRSAPRPSANGRSPAARPTSSSSTPATTRSSRSPAPCATSSPGSPSPAPAPGPAG